MLKVRVIPVLLLKKGRMVKPKQFGAKGVRDVGWPTTTARIYNSQDADELIFLDIDATSQSRKFLLETLREVAKNCFIPLTAGGGIKTLSYIKEILAAGADKISINTIAVEKPNFIKAASKRFGNQCITVAIDVKKVASGKYEVFTHGGKRSTGFDPVTFAKLAIKNGAGEILLTSIDNEGMMKGYDLDLLKLFSDLPVPLIAHGGAGDRQHFVDAVKIGHASAVAAASIFHFSDSNLTQVKTFMHNSGIPVRPI